MKTPRQTPKKRPAPKEPRTTKKKPSPFDLIEKKRPFRRIVEFPQMQGRTVERIRFFTGWGDDSISINFQDKTLLSLAFDTGFTLHAQLSDIQTGNVRIIKEWPPIPSEPSFLE
jgi:hypothetical protein